jgi:protein-disulfide isomerase
MAAMNQTLEMPVPRGATDDKTGVAVGTGPVDIDVYIDFQCPYCKQFELVSGDTIDRLLDRQLVRFVRHPMNILDNASTTHYSTRAAAAAAAASDAGRFHEYAQALFEHQPPEGSPGLADDQLIDLGRTVGITDPSFAGEIQDGTYVPWPGFVTERALASGVGGTPSVFVQGTPMPTRPHLIVAAVERVAGRLGADPTR